MQIHEKINYARTKNLLLIKIAVVLIFSAKSVTSSESSFYQSVELNQVEIIANQVDATFILSDSIPQGRFIYELYFSEFGGRMANFPVQVEIIGNKITVFTDQENPLSGGKIIIKGILIKHKSGSWIIAEHLDDKDADEIGGCSDGPTPIDFQTRIIECC